MIIEFLFFFAITILLILWYSWGRNTNLKRAQITSAILEKTLKPLDQTYTWIGGVIGFYATYKVKGFKAVECTYRMLPRQSFLYYLFVLLTKRSDTIDILFRTGNRGQPEFHVLRSRFLGIPEKTDMRYEKVSIKRRKRYYIFHKGEKDLKELLHERLFLRGRLKRFSSSKETGTLYFSFDRKSDESLGEDMSWIVEFASDFLTKNRG